MMHLGQFHHGRRLRFQLRQLNGIALLRHFLARSFRSKSLCPTRDASRFLVIGRQLDYPPGDL